MKVTEWVIFVALPAALGLAAAAATGENDVLKGRSATHQRQRQLSTTHLLGLMEEVWAGSATTTKSVGVKKCKRKKSKKSGTAAGTTVGVNSTRRSLFYRHEGASGTVRGAQRKLDAAMSMSVTAAKSSKAVPYCDDYNDPTNVEYSGEEPTFCETAKEQGLTVADARVNDMDVSFSLSISRNLTESEQSMLGDMLDTTAQDKLEAWYCDIEGKLRRQLESYVGESITKTAVVSHTFSLPIVDACNATAGTCAVSSRASISYLGEYEPMFDMIIKSVVTDTDLSGFSSIVNDEDVDGVNEGPDNGSNGAGGAGSDGGDKDGGVSDSPFMSISLSPAAAPVVEPPTASVSEIRGADSAAATPGLAAGGKVSLAVCALAAMLLVLFMTRRCRDGEPENDVLHFKNQAVPREESVREGFTDRAQSSTHSDEFNEGTISEPGNDGPPAYLVNDPQDEVRESAEIELELEEVSEDDNDYDAVERRDVMFIKTDLAAGLPTRSNRNYQAGDTVQL